MLRALGNLFTHPCRSNTFYWEPDRKGEPRVKRRTATKKHLGALQRMRDWVREHRDQKLSRMMKTLKAKLQGTWNYYGVIGNYRRMKLLHDETCRAVYKWLNRRSQRRSLTWPGVNRLLARFQVPPPRIMEKNGGMPCQMELSFCQRMLDFDSAGRFRWRMRERVDLKSPVRENRPPGSVRGARGNPCPYLDRVGR